jgi:Tol biopolymer transport system component
LYDQDGSTPTTTDIHELNLLSGESRLLTQGGQNKYPSWSPDGTMIAFSGGEHWQEQTLVIMRVADGSTIRPLDVVGVGPVAWSPDGSIIAFEWEGAVYTIDTAAALGEWLTSEE